MQADKAKSSFFMHEESQQARPPHFDLQLANQSGPVAEQN
jgi:hypothetical protein